MSPYSPEELRAAEDAVVILVGLSRALADPQTSPSGSQYAEQVSAAAEAVELLVANHRHETPDPIWAGIAAEEHRREICYHLNRPR